MQRSLFEPIGHRAVPRFATQLLKWVGNKQRYAHEIASYFPESFGTYFEPFLGSGGVLGVLHPNRAVAADIFPPLVKIWQTLQEQPSVLKAWYADRWAAARPDRRAGYERIKATYNAGPNAADLLFLCRACYGGVVRFRKSDGYMSTPCGIHEPVSPSSFNRRVDLWHDRTSGTQFVCQDFADTMECAKPGDLVYCDPPYSHSQGILYGAQAFSLGRLFAEIASCKSRGVFVVLSIDGVKKSGQQGCPLPIPPGLFEREVFVNCGRSMLRRFQLPGQTLETEVVADRLLLTF